MPTPLGAARSARNASRFRELFSPWWEHRASFVISVAITLVALGVFFFSFLGDRNTPLFDFLKRVEYSTPDTCFRYRPTRYTPPDPRIVVVAIDQRS
jgi:CHASE2 domain-containing sensor protein